MFLIRHSFTLLAEIGRADSRSNWLIMELIMERKSRAINPGSVSSVGGIIEGLESHQP
jgi:hypothetical protein